MLTKNTSFTIFLHIQKTGGLTLQRILRQQLGPSLPQRMINLLRATPSDQDFLSVLKSRRANDRYFAGHVCFGVHQHLPHPFSYITLLREPVARIVSLYHYSRTNPTAYYHRYAVNQTLEAFALEAPLMELDNGQTRFLAGDERDCFINRTPLGQCEPTLMNIAKDNIHQHFSLVGLTEQFDQSLLLLQRKMGWQQSYYLSRNIAKAKPKHPISDHLRAAILERNSLDHELYQYAQRYFLQELTQWGINDCMVQQFKQRNATYNTYFTKPYDLYEATKSWVKQQVFS
jgi:Galactose-3-O-sulfotransferase